MKLISGILLTTIAVGAAWGQNPDIIQNTKNTLNAVAKKAELDQNAALQTAGVPSKPAAGTAAKTSVSTSKMFFMIFLDPAIPEWLCIYDVPAILVSRILIPRSLCAVYN